MKNATLKDVLFQGGKINETSTQNRVEKKWVGNQKEPSNKEKNKALKEVSYHLWFDLFTVKISAYFLLPFFAGLLLNKFGPAIFSNPTLDYQGVLPLLGDVTVSGKVACWLLLSVSFMLFGLLLKQIKDDGALPATENVKLFNALYDSTFLRKGVWFYSNVSQFVLLVFAYLAWLPIFGFGVFVLFSYVFAYDKFQTFPMNPLSFLVIMGGGWLSHFIFLPPERPDRRKFGLSTDFKEYLLKDSYIPYRNYQEKPRDLVPSITYYILFIIKTVSTAVLNVLLWALNRFHLKRALIVFYPVAWLYDLLEIVSLDLVFYAFSLCNYLLGWVFTFLAWGFFVLGLGVNTYRMFVLEKSFSFGGLVLNLILVGITLLVFTHLFHTAKFFKAVEEQGVRKPLKEFLKW